MSHAHYFSCRRHGDQDHRAELITPTERRPSAPLCSTCYSMMEYVGCDPVAKCSQHFAALTPVEHEMLAHLCEELCEAGKKIMKTFRHGLESHHPNNFPIHDNRREIETEVGHVAAAVDMLIQLGVLSQERIDRGRDEKFKAIGEWLHHVTISGGTVAVPREVVK